MSVRPRSVVDLIPPYRPGKPAAAEALKLSSNENPLPPLPGVVERAAQELRRMNRYPDAGTRELREGLAGHLDIEPQQLATGTGSVSVLFALLNAFLAPGDEIVYAWRSFEAYPIAADLTGATSVRVPLLPDGRHDISAMADAVTERTRAVLVCTPNNPTGPVVTEAELAALLSRVPDNVLVVVDEAYVEFVTDPDACSGLAAWRTHSNVVVLRTFSKAYGLAGLRVGYAVAHDAVAAAVAKVVPPFSVSDVASAAAIASLEATDELAERVQLVVAERQAMAAAFADHGWQVPEPQGNFIWLSLGDEADHFADACAPVSVRLFDGEGVRISIGTPDVNRRLIERVLMV